MSVRSFLSAYRPRSATAAMVLLALVSTAYPTRADMVTGWNVIALDTISTSIGGPPHACLIGQGTSDLADGGWLRPALAARDCHIPREAIIGRGLRARTRPAQKTEARVGCAALNRMTWLGMPMSQSIT